MLCAHVSMAVCMHVCTCVCGVHACLYVCEHGCVHARACMCVHGRMHTCVGCGRMCAHSTYNLPNPYHLFVRLSVHLRVLLWCRSFLSSPIKNPNPLTSWPSAVPPAWSCAVQAPEQRVPEPRRAFSRRLLGLRPLRASPAGTGLADLARRAEQSQAKEASARLNETLSLRCPDFRAGP